MSTVISIINQKGGTGKSVTSLNLGVGLARQGYKTLLVDVDSQGSLTASMGWPQPDSLPITLSGIMSKLLDERTVQPGEGILSHIEGVDLMPANIELAVMEQTLVNAMSRETVLRQYIDTVRDQYDFIILDCSPSLGQLTVNALAAADSVIIPAQAQYLSVKGMEQLLQTIVKVRRHINPRLQIDGILLTMVDMRTTYAREIIALLNETYGGRLHIYPSHIPMSVRVSEASAAGVSVYTHDPKGKAAAAYQALSMEVISKWQGQASCKMSG